jgi:enoyl-CoA hydratase/carnithine racemase
MTDMECKMGESSNVNIKVEDRVAVVTLNNPPLNTINTATLEDLIAAMEQVLADDEVKVIVITGSGRSFCAGADVKEFQQVLGTPAFMKTIRDGHQLFTRIEMSSKPVIAAVNGRFCLGGGCELALSCHIRIAEEGVKFGQTEIKLGLIPGWGGTQRLGRLVGLGRALEMILTGDHIRTPEAYRIGLVNKVVPKGEALEAALRTARRLAVLSGVALGKALAAVYEGLDMTREGGLANEVIRFSEVAESEDIREGLTAFLEKRRPQFKDR